MNEFTGQALDELVTYSMLAKAMQVPGQMTVEALLERARGV